MNDRKADNLELVKMLNDANPNHREDTRTGQSLNRHERRKAASLARRKNKQGERK